AVTDALRVFPSAHLNPNGYIPATACVGPPGASRDVFVTFLDDRQLSCMDKTEPNYNRVALDPHYHPVLLDSGERLAGCDIYESRHGVVADRRLTDGLETMPPQRALVENLLRELPMLRDRGLTVEGFV